MRLNPMKTGCIILLAVLLLAESTMEWLGILRGLLVIVPLFLLAFVLINRACNTTRKYIWIGRKPGGKKA